MKETSVISDKLWSQMQWTAGLLLMGFLSWITWDDVLSCHVGNTPFTPLRALFVTFGMLVCLAGLLFKTLPVFGNRLFKVMVSKGMISTILILWLLLGVNIVVQRVINQPIYTAADFIPLPLTMKYAPHYFYSSYKNLSTEWLTFYPDKYPQFTFRLSPRVITTSVGEDIERFVSQGDTVTIYVLKQDYQGKLSQPYKVPTLLERCHCYYNIDVFAAKDNDRTYVPIDITTLDRIGNISEMRTVFIALPCIVVPIIIFLCLGWFYPEVKKC